MPTGTFHVTHYRDWASKRSYFKTSSSFHLDSSPISRALPVRNPISNTIWNLCRYPHQLLQRSLRALAMQAAKLYHPSLVAVQGHWAAGTAPPLWNSTGAALTALLQSFQPSAQLQRCCSVLVKHSSCQKPLCSPCSKCSSFSRAHTWKQRLWTSIKYLG